MSLILNSCIKYNEVRKVCVASEHGKRYTLNNTSNYKIKKVRIDGCIPQKIGEKRSDFLFQAIKGEKKKAIFIELKGGALMDAVKQLYDTITYLKSELKGDEIYARIVGTSDVPKIKSSAYYQKLFRETKGNIKRATNRVLIENIENI